MSTRQRRSLWSDIFQSDKVNKLSDSAALLYTWSISNFDDYGFQDGDPRVIKGVIFPKRDHLTVEKIEELIEEILSIQENPPLWRIYCIENQRFIQDPVWFDRQSFHAIRRKPSKILKLITEHQIDTGLSPDLVHEGCQFGSLSEVKLSEVKLSEASTTLAKLFLKEIKNWFPKYREPPSLNGWAKSIDEMIRIDKRTPEEIDEVIRWCQKDFFWRKNILSGTTLRLKFNRLQAEIVSPQKGKNLGAGVDALDKEMQEAFKRAGTRRIEHKR